MFTKHLTNLLALSATVFAIAFDGPFPTPVNDLHEVNINGWTPKPTNTVRSFPELFRRQQNNQLCGYVEGDGAIPISCSTGSCFSNTTVSWFGCCTGTGFDSCNVATRCVASASVNSCLSDSSCSNDPYVTACTATSAPFCAEVYSVMASQNTVTHLVCAASSTVVQVFASSTSANSSSSSSSGSAKTSAKVSATSGSAAATSLRSTGAAPMQTARAVVGGIVGVVALLF